MKNSPDPSVHRQREQQFIQHVERLLNDERLRLEAALPGDMAAFAEEL